MTLDELIDLNVLLSNCIDNLNEFNNYICEYIEEDKREYEFLYTQDRYEEQLSEIIGYLQDNLKDVEEMIGKRNK
jgi:hypothetical protein